MSLQTLIKSQFLPTDATALALFRIAFGFLMMLDIPQERGLEDADIRFGDAEYCFFPLFQWVRPVSAQVAVALYSLMWLASLCICLGYKFKLACITYLCPYCYFLLLDKSRWNNHSYLFALLGGLLGVGGAGGWLSLDNYFKETPTGQVARWNYTILKFQLFVLYFFAGIKKLDSDWIGGWSMRNLGRRGVFRVVGVVLGEEEVEFYVVHWGGLIFDLSIGFMLNLKGFKMVGIFLSVVFHGINAIVFDIGMFPYVCLASLVLFWEEEWVLVRWLRSTFKPSQKQVVGKLTPQEKRTSIFLLFYIFVQIFLPFSHFVTKGYNNWTPGLYGYSWDMMVNSWETLHQKITIKGINGEERFLDGDVWVANDRWSSHADMAVQHAACISRNLAIHNITGIRIYFDIWKSLNGRFQQRIYDPRVDILTAPWSPFTPTPWLLPLLTEYEHYRTTFDQISKSLTSNWSDNQKDVIFVADFPGLTLENYLPNGLNVSLGVISGHVIVEGHINTTLTENMTVVIKGQGHKVHTVGSRPSCYYYGFTNGSRIESTGRESKLLNDLLDWLLEKFEIHSRCFYLVVNSWLNLVFDVPMVLRRRV